MSGAAAGVRESGENRVWRIAGGGRNGHAAGEADRPSMTARQVRRPGIGRGAARVRHGASRRRRRPCPGPRYRDAGRGGGGGLRPGRAAYPPAAILRYCLRIAFALASRRLIRECIQPSV